MIDGLYRVHTRHLCAGFLVMGGAVKWCAPILRRKLDYWKSIARRIGDAPNPPECGGEEKEMEK